MKSGLYRRPGSEPQATLAACASWFAGPTTKDFVASVNFYDVHYMDHHVVGSSGGNTGDMRRALDLMAKDVIKLMSAAAVRPQGIPTGSGGFKEPACKPSG